VVLDLFALELIGCDPTYLHYLLPKALRGNGVPSTTTMALINRKNSPRQETLSKVYVIVYGQPVDLHSFSCPMRHA
jgi:hypothetical protein